MREAVKGTLCLFCELYQYAVTFFFVGFVWLFYIWNNGMRGDCLREVEKEVRDGVRIENLAEDIN